MSEPEPTPEELREAEALARALEGGRSAGAAPERAAAALLAYSHHGGLSPEAKARGVVEVTRLRGARWRWSVRAGALAVSVAAAALVVVYWPRMPSSLPPPDVELLRAQSRAAGGDAAAVAAMDERMRGYRGQLLASLERRYGR
jgi:hypothetical protein